MAISSTTARADIFKEFYATIKDNITTSGVKVTSAFVDKLAQLPQIVVGTPVLPRQRARFGAAATAFDRDGDIEVMVYAKTMKQLVELVDDTEQSIFNNLSDLNVENVALGEGSDDSFELEAKHVRVMVLPFTFQFKR